MRPSRAIALNLLLLAVLGGVLAWVLLRGTRLRDDPAEVLAALQLSRGPQLPAAAAVGAAGAEPQQRYDRDTLYEYIDGAAESFISRGFTGCVVTTYRFASPAGEFEVAAESYRFAAPDGALAQAEAERPGSARPLAGVTDAWSDGALLVRVEGRDLLKATALATGPHPAAALESVARAWKGGA